MIYRSAHSTTRAPPTRDAMTDTASACLARMVAAAMKPSLGPNWPLLLEAPGEGAPPTPPPSTVAAAVGRVVGVTEVEDVEVALAEVPFVAVVKGSTEVMRLVETRVVVTRPEPSPMLVVTEVKTTVVFWAAVVVALPVVEAAVVEAAVEEVLLAVVWEGSVDTNSRRGQGYLGQGQQGQEEEGEERRVHGQGGWA
ncbi:hypothetical protein HYPSUDRAFT_499500 [Hypholoma sublateritium FD-334 SS-4]|uniref:Uncharacterized protein n=1 Tax=Hypholoma sublateritium (strain FD-334 SS-4) TaxID=945553 RepID=A0A0D2LMJ9_HYPSF|nr:hypothetical protein HYPSUDRAFT_499500 [Hypholoma sublateritium FD-334 SS-4]